MDYKQPATEVKDYSELNHRPLPQSEPIRILHIVHSMNAGGIETFLMTFYRCIDRNKIQFDFLVNTTEECLFFDEIRALGGRIHRIITPCAIRSLPQYEKELFLFFKTHKEYRIIHSHRNATSMYALRQAARAKVPVRIAHCHTEYAFSMSPRVLFAYWNKLFIKQFATHWFACSRSAGRWMYGEKALRDSRFRVIPNAIHYEKFIFSSSKRQALRKELGLDSQFVIGHTGRFTTPKNHNFLVDVFSELLRRVPNSVLLLVGDGDLRPAVEEQCRQLQIQNSVIFTGVKRNVEDYYQAMDLFAFPSLYEGLGIVAVEAQAAGLPCLCSDRVPQEAAVTDLCRFLPLEKEKWVDSILQSMEQERRDMRQQLEYSNYNVESAAKKLQDFYLQQSV